MLTRPDLNRPVEPSDRRPHAVVIGSGFGGLAAAIRLGARGFRVTVLERLDRIGGRASVLKQDGFTFDRGPTIVTAPFLFEELWTLAGKRMADDVDLRPLDPFYRIRFDDGSHVDCFRDTDAMRREVARIAPDDVAGWERFMVLAREICRIGFEELGHKPFSSFTDMLRIAPDLIRLQGWRSVHGLVSTFVREPRLRTVLSFHPLLIGGNPFRTPAIYCLIPDLERRWGVHYPIGGVGQLVDGLAGLVVTLGGTVRVGADVTCIETQDAHATGVRLATGERIPADLVISNADTATTYGTLLAKAAPRRWSDRRLARVRHSMGLLVWYFGVQGHLDDVNHHTILLGPRYKGLIEDIFERKKLTEDFSIYLHRPSASDPNVAPGGCDAFYALTPVPNLDAAIDWSIETERRRKAIEMRLEETILPGLSHRIVTSHVISPVDFRDDYLSARGAGFGFEPVLTQSAWFRPHNRSEAVDNLFLVGAGTHPGAGLPGVLSSARILDGIVPHASAFVH
ncbi:phytoene desaturase [Aquibium carbonis]|uniref:Phytoene dehydrogenase n=1 Tax=Aquibium carbonis TaxID=2495581 RepID=A0A3R9ZPP6_9HYPH|nr:phytoene desaturase [Aquibium carbonis]RST84703.1 phytoene desaturase [Aquibium carbonis]